MKTVCSGSKERVIIEPGEYYVSAEDVIISTLLGSCVAACLFDPVNRVIGMNHFLLANRRYALDTPVIVSEAGRYGIHAMELLVNAMFRRGAERKNLRAKAFGGGNVIAPRLPADNFSAVGDVNVRFIKEFLRNEGIPLVSSSLGGANGRVIHFLASDFSVLMKTIEMKSREDVANTEHRFWEQRVKEQEQQPKQDVLFW